MPRGGLTRGRGWGSRCTRSCNLDCDDGNGHSRSCARRRASTTQRVDHGLEEASISPFERIPRAPVDLDARVGGHPGVKNLTPELR